MMSTVSSSHGNEGKLTMKEDRTLLNLPPEINNNGIAPHLSLSDLTRLMRTCRQANTLFSIALPTTKVKALLQYVAFGEETKAERLMKNDPKLLLMKGQVTDYSNRTFRDITAFQYAIWALDEHMWNVILKYLPKETAATQLAEHIYNQPSDNEMHGVYYDFMMLINALQTYVTSYDPVDASKNITLWCQTVGGAERLVPTHVANEYFQKPPQPPYTIGTDTTLYKNLPRKLTLRNTLTSPEIHWYLGDGKSKLGVDYAILRRVGTGCGEAPGMRPSLPHFGAPSQEQARFDLDAAIALHEARTRALIDLKEQLGINQYESYKGQEKSRCIIS
jgi:hypothetical protein